MINSWPLPSIIVYLWQWSLETMTEKKKKKDPTQKRPGKAQNIFHQGFYAPKQVTT